MDMTYTLFAIASVVLATTNSLANLDTTFNAIGHANGVAMANPPLPILRGKSGAYKLSVQPGIFAADETSPFDTKTVDYKGTTAALLFSKMWSDSLGYYVIGMGTKLSGDLSSPGQSGATIHANDIESSLFMAGAGLNFFLLNNDFISLPIFAGPMLISANVSQHTRQVNGSTTLDDFEAEVSPSVLGLMVGLQAGFHFSKYFSLNPYVVMAEPLNSDDLCHEYTASNIRVSGSLRDLSSPGCKTNSSQSLVEFDVFLQSFGVNLLFPSLGLGINAFAESGDVPLFSGVKVQSFFITLNFGQQ